MLYKPFNNDLGQRIYDNVSQEAWKQWIEPSKMIVNEYRLDLTSPQGQKLLMEQAEKFFFGGGDDRQARRVRPARSEVNRLKIESTIENARHVLEVAKEFGSFDAYVWGFVGGGS